MSGSWRGVIVQVMCVAGVAKGPSRIALCIPLLRWRGWGGGTSKFPPRKAVCERGVWMVQRVTVLVVSEVVVPQYHHTHTYASGPVG